MSVMHKNLPTFLAGVVVAIVGFFSSFPILLQGLDHMEATPAQAASGLMAAALAMGLAGIGLSLWQKMPISVAWSTPGAALLAVTAPDAAGFAGAVGAFVVAGVLTVLAGFWQPLARLATAIPAPVTQAMLAGVLLSICIGPVLAVAEVPHYALPIIATWFFVGRWTRHFAAPAAIVAMVAVIFVANGFALPLPDQVLSRPEVVAPVFSPSAVIGIAVPLFLVTMATQNVPGVSVLGVYGFRPPAGPLFSTVGAASVISAPLGAPVTCLAAITAVMCAGEDADPDPALRYRAAVWAGVFYCLFGGVGGRHNRDYRAGTTNGSGNTGRRCPDRGVWQLGGGGVGGPSGTRSRGSDLRDHCIGLEHPGVGRCGLGAGAGVGCACDA